MAKNLISFDDYINNRSTANESYSSFDGNENRTVDSNELKEMLEQAYESKERGNEVKPIFIYSDPGTGKTNIVNKASEELGVPMLVVDLPFVSQEDILGIPKVSRDEATGKSVMRSVPSTIFPMDNGQDGKGGFILLNDMNRANRQILNSLMQFFQMGRIGNYQLPDKWIIVATGDNYRELDPAMADRFNIVNLVPTMQSWTGRRN
jgi:MoxR-like ATPase